MSKQPWYYRWRFTNWLMAKPWQWNYRVIYRNAREEFSPMRSVWLALTFPHVHHWSED